MAITDIDLVMSDAQAETTVATHDSTNYVDLQAAASTLDKDNFLIVSVNTTATSGGSATVQVTVETDNDLLFGSPKIIHQTAAVAVADLVQGYEFIKWRLPAVPELERYLQVTYTIGTAVLTAGKFDAYLCDGTDFNNK
jgi:hypothetical protein